MATRFADTTAVFEWHAGRGEPRAEVRGLLGAGHAVVGSEAVEREWKRIVFDATNAVLKAAGETNLSYFFAELSSGFGRAHAQRFRALSMLAGRTDHLNLTEMKLRSGQMLRGDMNQRFEQVVKDVRRPSQCGLARQNPVPAGAAWRLKKTCKIREGICVHEARLDTGDDANRWAAGAAALRAAKPYKKMGDIADKMLGEPRVRTGRNCYGSTGDLCIALDGEPAQEIVTTDKIFTVLGPAMGLTVHLVKTSPG